MTETSVLPRCTELLGSPHDTANESLFELWRSLQLLKDFRTPSSNCIHNTASLTTSSVSSNRINWWSFSCRHFDRILFILVHRWWHKRSRLSPTTVNNFIWYLVSSPLPDTVTTSQSSCYNIFAVQCDIDINRMWSLEAIGIHQNKDNADSTTSNQTESISFENN